MAASTGFSIDQRVLIDTADGRGIQEEQIILDIPDTTHLVVGRLLNDHGGTRIAFPIVQPAAALEETLYTTCSVKVGPDSAKPNDPVTIAVASSSGFVVGQQLIIDASDARGIQEAQLIVDVPDAVAHLQNPRRGSLLTVNKFFPWD